MLDAHPFQCLLKHVRPENLQVVFDLGCGTGADTRTICTLLRRSRVFAFECSSLALAASRAALGGLPVELVPLAVSNYNGTIHLFSTATNSAVASTLAPLVAAEQPLCELVPCTRMDTWIANRGLVPDVVWCDVEGDTLRALEGFGEYLARVTAVYFPTSYRARFVRQPVFRDHDDLLRSHGLVQVAHEQSLPGHWGYALYVNSQASVPARSTPSEVMPDTTSLPFARGGIGDLLQSIPAATSARRIRVYSHHANAPEVFQRFGVSVDHVHYQANTAILSHCQTGTELRREYFPQISMPAPACTPQRRSGGRLIGLHPYGSRYANTFAERLLGPVKWMDNGFLDALLRRVLQSQDSVLLFCAPEERPHADSYKGHGADQVTIVAYRQLWDSLSMVPACDAVIGVDSSIKTMSSMLRVPTVTLVGDFHEPFRDRHFLDPYVQAGVMRTVRYTRLGNQEADAVAREYRSLVR